MSKGIDPNKSNKSEEWMICHHWFFLYGFKNQDSAFGGCHDLTILSLNISDVTIVTVKYVDYRCIIHNISKSAAINLFKTSVLKARGYI